MEWVKIIGLVVLGAITLFMLATGGFYTLLTWGGDRGGDSGLRQAGCLSLIGGVIALAMFAALWKFA